MSDPCEDFSAEEELPAYCATCGWRKDLHSGNSPVELAVAAERERCAKIAEEMDTPHHMYTQACREIAARIRSTP